MGEELGKLFGEPFEGSCSAGGPRALWLDFSPHAV